MNHAEMRTTVKLLGGANGDDWSDSDIDRAFRNVATEYIKRSRALDSTATITLTANDPTVANIAASATDLLAERITAAEIGYVDRSQWSASSVSYAVRDIVQGDGNPDLYLYRCITAHTSTDILEPPNGTYWERVFSKLGTKVFTNYSYDAVRRFLVQDGKADVPTRMGFETNVKAHLWPAPDAAYKLVIKYWAPLESWTIGSTNATLNLKDEYIETILPVTAAILDSPNPHALTRNAEYQRMVSEAARSDADAMARPSLDWKDLDEYTLSYPMT